MLATLSHNCEIKHTCLYTFNVFAWYTCISATHVGFISTKSTERNCTAKFTRLKLENCVRPTSTFMHSDSVEVHAGKVEVTPSGVSMLGYSVDGEIFQIC